MFYSFFYNDLILISHVLYLSEDQALQINKSHTKVEKDILMQVFRRNSLM